MNDEQTPALREAVENMANMREAYDNLSQAAEAYNTGKTELAQNITAKGVPASASETLPELAEKVNAIAQESYTIDGGEMYAKQLFGSLETPNYWNLYEVLENLLSDGRLVNYGGILLAEYYKGYDSLALSGAGSGGAYVVSDKDSQGNFIMYTADTTHTWDDDCNGKGNRWVAYCFADEGHDFDITDTNTCPRTIHIGRHVGTITSLVNGRISQIVVTDGNILDDFQTSSYTQNWDKRIIFRNLVKHASSNMLYNVSAESIFIELDEITSGSLLYSSSSYPVQTLIVKTNKVTGSAITWQGATVVYVECPTFVGLCAINNGASPIMKKVFLRTEEIPSNSANFIQQADNLEKIYIGYFTNDKTKSVSLRIGSAPEHTFDLELQDGWCKNFYITKVFKTIELTEEDMYAHILQKLKQDEEDCGDGLTISLGSNNLAKLTSAESVALLDSLTNTYGYTFA